MNRIAAMSEHTLWFGFFLFLFIAGMILAARFIGSYFRPVSQSAADTLQAI